MPSALLTWLMTLRGLSLTYDCIKAEALGVVTNLLARDGLTPEENRFLAALQRAMPAL
jgi:hypothetical protein